MDELAAELGIDPLELRERNWIKHEEFPYTTICRAHLRLRQLRGGHRPGQGAVRLRRAARRAGSSAGPAGDPVQLGIGISTYTEMCGLAPSRVLGSLAYGAGGWEHASIRMLPTGKVEVVTGSSAHGQGHETAWSQIVADQLGVPFEDIRVLHGDTQVSPKGMDTYGSRSLAVGGMALVGGLRQGASRRPRSIASAHARGAAGGPGVRRRRVQGPRRPGVAQDHPGDRVRRVRRAQPARRRRAVARLRRHLRPGQLLVPARHAPVRDRGGHRDRAGEDPLLRGGRRRRQGGQPADRRGPGARRPRPGHRPGAVRGGRLRRRRQPDHHARSPTTWCRPRPTCRRYVTDRTETPATTNPLGVKGVGEAGTIASTPAVVNAIVDALRPLGRHGHHDAVHAGAGLAAPGRVQGTRSRRDRPPARQRDSRRRRDDPGEVRLRPAGLAWTRRSRALADGGEDAKVIAGGQSLLPLLRLRLAYPDLLVDSAASTSCAASATPATRW